MSMISTTLLRSEMRQASGFPGFLERGSIWNRSASKFLEVNVSVKACTMNGTKFGSRAVQFSYVMESEAGL